MYFLFFGKENYVLFLLVVSGVSIYIGIILYYICVYIHFTV